MNKVENKAENHLIVGSLEVIQDVSGAGFDVITRAIDSLQQGISTVAKKQTDFFKNISDDSIVTPSEKATLKKQWDEIVNEYYAIMDLAEKKQCEDTNEVREYSEAYNELRNYLFSELHIFDDMSSNTALPNVDTFNGLYENYYNKQKYAENRCAAGNDYWTLRVLDNLDQSGSDNEVAVYMGNLYKYSTQEGKWRQVSTAEYYGVKDEFFEANLDDYFLSITDSVKTVLKIDDEGILVNEDGLPILFDYETEAGTIYRMDVAGWNKIEDRNDWHYVVAQNDLLAAGLAPSPALKEYVDNQVEKVGLPAYMGPLAEPPASWHPGDWFIYSGSESVIWEYAEGLSINLYKGHVYKFNSPTWTDLDPSDSRYNQEFMTALNDLIDLNMGKDAYFANLFVKKIFAMQAVIEELQTKVIELTEGGCIKTQGYEKGSDEKGVYIGANGDFECTDGKFKGEVNATSGTFYGNVKIGPQIKDGEGFIEGTAIENGEVNSKSGYIKDFWVKNRLFSKGFIDYGDSIKFKSRIDTYSISIFNFNSIFSKVSAALPYATNFNSANLANGYVEVRTSGYGVLEGNIVSCAKWNSDIIQIYFGFNGNAVAPFILRINSNDIVTIYNLNNAAVTEIKLFMITLKGM